MREVPAAKGVVGTTRAKTRKRMKTTGRKTGNRKRNSGHFKKGEDPLRGVGKKGKSGRPPNEFREACAMLTYEKALPKIKAYKGVHRSAR